MTVVDDDELERRLRATFDAVADTIDDDGVDVDGLDVDGFRLVPLDDDAPIGGQRPQRRRLGFAAAAAAIAAVAAGSTAWVGSITDETPVASPPATTALAEQQSVVSSADRAACAARRPGRSVGPEVLDFNNAVMLRRADDADIVDLVTVTDGWLLRCSIDVDPSPAQPRTHVEIGPISVETPPPGEVVVVRRGTALAGNPDRGPGTVDVVGWVGPGVRGVAMDLPDGSRRWGTVSDGWYIVRADLARDVVAEEERIVWILADGSERSRRADLLDDETSFERCAAQPGCVDEAVRRLRDAQPAGSRTARILDDLHVTSQEYEHAVGDYVACLRDAGYKVWQHGRSIVDSGELASMPPDTCAPDRYDAVSEAWAYLDAENRLNEP